MSPCEPAEPTPCARCDSTAEQIDRLQRRVDRERRRRLSTEKFLDDLTREGVRDPVTGLPTRAPLLDRLGLALHRAARHEGKVGLVLLDLESLSHLPGVAGSQGNDEVLREVARRLSTRIGVAGTVARVGSAEFAVLLDDVEDGPALEALARVLASDLAEPVTALGVGVGIRADIGLSLAEPTEPAESVLREAEAALYVAKSRGTGRSVLFESAQARRVAARRFESDLMRALRADEIVPFFQPVVDLQTGVVVGAEALVRWHHPTRGWLPPSEFIAKAEEDGLIGPVTDRVLMLACAHAARWSSADRPFVVHVNLSGRDLSDPALLDRVVEALGVTGLRARSLCLEITERALVADDSIARCNVSGLRELGVALAIDDFGVEYASFSYLRRFPVALVKIDRSFVEHLAHDPRDRAVVAGMVAMATALDMRVVAEGVETVEQAEELRDLGVHEAQGWLFGRPAPASDDPPAVAGSAA